LEETSIEGDNNIKTDLQKEGCEGMDWIDLAKDRDKCQALEHGNETLGSIKCGKFLDYLRTS